MYPGDTEILFPFRVAETLRDLRGPRWSAVVQKACAAPENSVEQLAFSLMLIRLCGCLTCHTNSYRALRGCTKCALHSIRRFKGPDDELAELYANTLEEVSRRMQEEQDYHVPVNPRIQECSTSE